jgi:hypothetical protein
VRSTLLDSAACSAECSLKMWKLFSEVRQAGPRSGFPRPVPAISSIHVGGLPLRFRDTQARVSSCLFPWRIDAHVTMP